MFLHFASAVVHIHHKHILAVKSLQPLGVTVGNEASDHVGSTKAILQITNRIPNSLSFTISVYAPCCKKTVLNYRQL